MMNKKKKRTFWDWKEEKKIMQQVEQQSTQVHTLTYQLRNFR